MMGTKSADGWLVSLKKNLKQTYMKILLQLILKKNCILKKTSIRLLSGKENCNNFLLLFETSGSLYDTFKNNLEIVCINAHMHLQV